MENRFVRLKKIKAWTGFERTGVELNWRLRLYFLLFILVVFSLTLSFFVMYGGLSPEKALVESLSVHNERYRGRLEAYFSHTAAQGLHFARQAVGVIEKTLADQGASFDDVPDNQELIALLEKNVYDLLYNNLIIADCSGAFIIFNATVNTRLPGAADSRSGVYLQLANVNTHKPVNPKTTWTRGIAEIGITNDLVFNNYWELEFDISRIPFYNEVIRNASLDLTDCYYYSPAFRLHGEFEKAMFLMAPLVGENGRVYGVCGFEISALFFKLAHEEAGSLERRIIRLVAQKDGPSIMLETGFESGSPKGFFAGLGNEALTAEPKVKFTRYRLSDGVGGGRGAREFIGQESPIFLSPLSERLNPAWATASLIPKEDYDRVVRRGYIQLALFCAVFLTVAAWLANTISKRYNLPILRGLDAIKEGSLRKTNINEIDDLLESLAKSNTAGHADMSGFYEFQEKIKTLTRSEATIFNLYMEGFSASEIAEKVFISINTVKSHNKNIYRKLNVSSLKELLVYAQMMKKADQGPGGAMRRRSDSEV